MADSIDCKRGGARFTAIADACITTRLTANSAQASLLEPSKIPSRIGNIEEADLNHYTLPAKMLNVSRILGKTVIVLLLLVALCAGVLIAYRISSDRETNNTYQTMHGWQPNGGRWSEHDGVFSNATYGRGDMLIAQHSQGTNYKVSADIRFDLLFPETHYGDAGLVIRTTNPEQGVDSYQGYYAGLRPDQRTVVLGRASYDWHELKTVPLTAPIWIGEWYHLELSAQGCKLTVTVTAPDNAPATKLDYQDAECLTAGVAGLRSFYAQASWRDVKISF